MQGDAPEPADLRFGPVTYLMSASGGRYPDGNSLLVEGERETVLIDPAVGLRLRRETLPRIDRVIHSHCHEDHVAGSHLFPDVPWHFHELDLPGITSLDAMMAIYGFDGPIDTGFRKVLVEEFHYTPRADATPYTDGAHFDLGGVRIDVQHTPGHTRGHCCLNISWQEGATPRSLLYLGDIELTSFGPYYGDAWSNLEDFERSLEKVRHAHADYYATFHHIGVLEGREAFLARLDIFEAKIESRESALLDYLSEPRTLEDLIAHRFIYRPTDPVSFADNVEYRSIKQHLNRLISKEKVRKLPTTQYQAVP